MNILEITNFSKQYFSGGGVSDINLSFEAGKTYGIIGPNGSGKSTLMKCIYNLVKGKGKIVSNGKEGYEIRKEVSYMPTEDYLLGEMSISEIANFYKGAYKDFKETIFYELIEKLEVPKDKKIGSLSTGMKVRLKIAVCLGRDTSVYMLDEPLNGIDVISRKLIIKSIKELKDEKKIFLISSHLLTDIEKLLDKVVFIKESKVVLEGNKSDYPSLEKVYWEVYHD